jgi:hypothetical protein
MNQLVTLRAERDEVAHRIASAVLTLMQVVDMHPRRHVPTAPLAAMSVTVEDITADAGELALIGFCGWLPRQRLEESPEEAGDKKGDEERPPVTSSHYSLRDHLAVAPPRTNHQECLQC